jgi:recombination protein RecA
MFDSGISYEGDLLDMALAGNIVEKSGAWLNYGTLRLGQGRENAKTFLLENKELCEEIKNKILVSKGFP